MIRTLRSKMDVTTSWTMKFSLGTRFVEESCGMQPTLGDRFTPQETLLNLHNSKYCTIDGGFDICTYVSTIIRFDYLESYNSGFQRATVTATV